MPFVALMLAASLIRNTALALLQSRFLIREIFWVDAVHFLGAPLLVWLLSRMHLFDTALDLMIINCVSLSASSAAGLVLSRRLWEWTRHPTRDDVWQVWEYGTFSLGGIASYLIYSKADTFILSGFSGPVQVALYNSVKVCTRVFEMVTQVVQMFLLPATSRLSSKGETGSLKAVVEKGILFATVGMLPVLVVLAVGSPLLIGLLYQGRYSGGVPILQVFALLSLVVPLIAVASNTLLGLGHARENFILGLHMLWISVLAYLICVPLWGAMGAAAGYVLASFIVSWLMAAAVRRHLPITTAGVLWRVRDITSFVRRRLGH
jgi:O-antigen/teichoic acid export membrane protein